MATKIFKLPQFSAEVILPKEYEATSVVVAGGRAPTASWLQEVAHNKKVYCADKGIEICLEAGVIPVELYGDGDSAPKELYEKAKDLGVVVKSYPAEKDDTDLQLLLENLPCGDVICAGVWGGRFDHLYSNVFSLLAYKEKNQGQVILADDKEVMLLVTAGEAVKLNLEKEVKALSLLPLSETSKVTLENVRWELNEAKLELLHPYAISNIPQGKVKLNCLEGKIGLYLCFVE